MVTRVVRVRDNAFSPEEVEAVYRAIRERRDVRSGFVPQPLEEETLRRLLAAAHSAPSVGLMQPWRFIVVRSLSTRRAVHMLFEQANAVAAAHYQGQQRALYSSLKLAGLLEAPQHLCVVCDEATTQGHGLGRHTMPQTAAYSAACAVENLWLAARAEGVGVGWVSIVDHAALQHLLHIPATAQVVAYLCIGYVKTFDDVPDLERAGWEERTPVGSVLRSERFDQPYCSSRNESL